MAFSLWLTVVLLLAVIAGLEGVEDSSLPPRACLLPPESGPCRAYFPRYFFHAKSGQCKKFAYGGCRGNRNNFRSKLSCERACLDADEPAKCDSPTGFCNYYKSPCPSGTKACNGRCTLSTNRCCCYNQPSTGSVTPKPTGGFEPGKCDWPTGMCIYSQDDCPPGTRLCAENNKGCEQATNKCCCNIKK